MLSVFCNIFHGFMVISLYEIYTHHYFLTKLPNVRHLNILFNFLERGEGREEKKERNIDV